MRFRRIPSGIRFSHAVHGLPMSFVLLGNIVTASVVTCTFICICSKRCYGYCCKELSCRGRVFRGSKPQIFITSPPDSDSEHEVGFLLKCH